MIGGWLDRQMLKGLYFLFTIGINVVAGTMVGYGIGWLLDVKLFGGRTSPWFTVAFLIIGTVAGFKSVFMLLGSRTAKKMREELGMGNVFEDRGENEPKPIPDEKNEEDDDDDYAERPDT